MQEAFDYIIIGAGIAGVSAAEAIRTKDQNCSIAIIGNELPGLYSRVLLPGYVKGDLKREQVMLRAAADFEKKSIQFVQGTVQSVFPSGSLIRMSDGAAIRYGKLLIAAGGSVRNFSIPGIPENRIYQLQTIDDAERIRRDLPQIKRPLVIGGGFIALEFLGILAKYSIPAAVLVKDDRLLARFAPPAASALVYENAARHGFSLSFGDEINIAREEGGIFHVETKKGAVIQCDAVLAGIGIQRNVAFLSDSGIRLGAGGVIASEYLETNIPGIYAAGDIAEYEDVVLGKRMLLGNWNNAFLQGTAAGKNMACPAGAGEAAPFKNVSSYGITNLGIHIAVLGNADLGLPSRLLPSPAGSHAEVFLQGDAVSGAVLINGAPRQALIRQWIMERKTASAIPELQVP